MTTARAASAYDDINKAYQLVLEEKFLADGE